MSPAGNWGFAFHNLSIAALAFIITFAFVPLVKRLAVYEGLMALPAADRWHSKPTPLLGGAAVIAGFVVAVALWGSNSWSMLAGALAMFLVGLVDDVFTLPPLPKFGLQLGVVAMILVHCPWLELSSWSWMNPVVTTVWLLTAVNAFNFIDGLDGLAAGVGIISAVTVALLALTRGEPFVLVQALALAGALAGFLMFNFTPASIFLGDAGALPVGLILGLLAIEASHLAISSHMIQALIPVLVMLVPVIDICSVVAQRIFGGVSIAHRGLDHTHHRLALLGLSTREVVWLTYAVAALGGLCAWALHSSPPFQGIL